MSFNGPAEKMKGVMRWCQRIRSRSVSLQEVDSVCLGCGLSAFDVDRRHISRLEVSALLRHLLWYVTQLASQKRRPGHMWRCLRRLTVTTSPCHTAGSAFNTAAGRSVTSECRAAGLSSPNTAKQLLRNSCIKHTEDKHQISESQWQRKHPIVFRSFSPAAAQHKLLMFSRFLFFCRFILDLCDPVWNKKRRTEEEEQECWRSEFTDSGRIFSFLSFWFLFFVTDF